MNSLYIRKSPAYYVRRTVFYFILGIVTFICLLPLYWMIRASFMKNTELMIFDPFVLWPAQMLWENYTEALSSMDFMRNLTNTLTILVGTMVGVLLTSSMAAYAFSRVRWKGRGACFAMIMSTMMLPGTVTLISQYVLWARLGFVDTYVPLILPHFFGGGAFNIFLLRQFYMNLPKELDEAAYVDGAGHMRIFFQIILPLAKSSLVVVALFTFLNTWNDFFGPLIYLNSRENYTLALGLLQFRGEYAAKWNLIMAGSTVVILPCIILYIIGQKQLIEGISLTGLKG